MGCCFNCFEFNIEKPKSYEIPIKRKCTNKICCLIFLIAWCFFIGLFIYAVSSGNQDKLWYGSDYLGNICGLRDINNTNCNEGDGCKYIYYPRINDDIILFSSKYVKGAAKDQSILPDPDDISLFGICMNKCPQIGEVVCTYDYQDKNIDANELTECSKPLYRQLHEICDHCWVVPLNTTSVLYLL